MLFTVESGKIDMGIREGDVQSLKEGIITLKVQNILGPCELGKLLA